MFSDISLGLDQWVGLGVAALLILFFALALVRSILIPTLPAASSGAPAPDCMVVIPARNEAACIARAVAGFPHDTVIVVDDHSTDGTAEVARKAGAGVLLAPPLPSGATGKANACLAGSAVLSSKWILFADADTWYEPGFLEAAVARAESGEFAFVSFYPKLECETAAEAILAPYAQAIFFCGVERAADPTAIFNGQCMLVRREAYEFVGAHRAVLNTITDDVKLAALARRHRMKYATFRTNLAHVRLREPWTAFRRGALRFMAVRFWMGMTLVAAAGIAALWLPVLAWLIAQHHLRSAAMFGLLPVILALPWYGNPLRALGTPLAIYGMIPILWKGVTGALGRGRQSWKGRTI